jgi:carbamoyltransferase
MLVLGINHSNDAAAALVRDGQVVAACAEERFSRIKHDASFPHQATRFVLEGVDGGLEGCDAVAFFWNPVQHMDAPHRRLVATPRSPLEHLFSLPNQLLAGCDPSSMPYAELVLPRPGGRPLQIFFVAHHLCHAAHAFFETTHAEAAILTVDGYGERVSTLIAEGRGTELRPLLEVRFPHSIGSVYAAFTQYLGFKPNSGEGKVMGLAAYGQPRYQDLMSRLLHPTTDGFGVDLDYFRYMMDGRSRFSQRLVDELGPPRDAGAPLEPRHMDIAASLQAATEATLLHLARLARKRTGHPFLCLAGGVALNCLANERIARESGFEGCFFQPACHDAGSSAGAALYVSHAILGAPRRAPAVKTDYLGPEFSPGELRSAIERCGLPCHELGRPAEHAAERLARGRFVARFDGRAEFGARALGNRSILARPGPQSVKDTLNARVKFREPFRPFAPTVTERRCGEYFDLSEPSPFMLRVYQTLPEHSERLGAVTHVDGGARVQTVTEEQNAAYFALLEAYGQRTGVECILNTSFNIRGEPIVQTPQDALKCFFTTGLDDLYLGPFHLEK